MDTLISLAAQYLYLAVPLLAVLSTALADQATRINMVKLSLVALAIALLIDQVLEQLFYIPRPFVVEQVSPLFPQATTSSFPSSHTLLAMTIAASMFAFNRRVGVVLTLLTLCVGVARVLAQVHYPVDIGGSICIALALTYLAFTTLKRLTLIT